MRRGFRLRKMRGYDLTQAVLSGLGVTALMLAADSGMMLCIDLPRGVIAAMTYIGLSGGSFLSGYIYGKRKRHGGIRSGIMCGLIHYAVIFCFGIVWTGGFPPLRLVRYLIWLILSGAAGGIVGVNSRIRRPPP